MIPESKNTVLYHASYMQVRTPEISRCRKLNDFGQGFYLTTSYDQAQRFVALAVRKNKSAETHGFINKYIMQDFQGLTCLEFATTDSDWLHCVCAYRRADLYPDAVNRWERYEAIAGKIADDDTMATLTVYLLGGYGAYGSQEAVDATIRQLKPERLSDQVCLKSSAALEKLVFVSAEKVVLR